MNVEKLVNILVIFAISVLTAFVLFFSVEEVMGEVIVENNRFLIGFLAGLVMFILSNLLRKNK